MTRPHSLTRTNSNNLNGSDTVTGGSIIMPIDIRDADTTMSITRNGMYTTNPMMNAARSSDRTNAGISVVSGTSFGVFGLAFFATVVNSAISSLRVCLAMNVRSGATPSWDASAWGFVPCRYGGCTWLFMSSSPGPGMDVPRT